VLPADQGTVGGFDVNPTGLLFGHESPLPSEWDPRCLQPNDAQPLEDAVHTRAGTRTRRRPQPARRPTATAT
jgi:hypothetical protein